MGLFKQLFTGHSNEKPFLSGLNNATQEERQPLVSSYVPDRLKQSPRYDNNALQLLSNSSLLLPSTARCKCRSRYAAHLHERVILSSIPPECSASNIDNMDIATRPHGGGRHSHPMPSRAFSSQSPNDRQSRRVSTHAHQDTYQKHQLHHHVKKILSQLHASHKHSSLLINLDNYHYPKSSLFKDVKTTEDVIIVEMPHPSHLPSLDLLLPVCYLASSWLIAKKENVVVFNCTQHLSLIPLYMSSLFAYHRYHGNYLRELKYAGGQPSDAAKRLMYPFFIHSDHLSLHRISRVPALSALVERAFQATFNWTILLDGSSTMLEDAACQLYQYLCNTLPHTKIGGKHRREFSFRVEAYPSERRFLREWIAFLERHRLPSFSEPSRMSLSTSNEFLMQGVSHRRLILDQLILTTAPRYSERHHRFYCIVGRQNEIIYNSLVQERGARLIEKHHKNITFSLRAIHQTSDNHILKLEGDIWIKVYHQGNLLGSYFNPPASPSSISSYRSRGLPAIPSQQRTTMLNSHTSSSAWNGAPPIRRRLSSNSSAQQHLVVSIHLHPEFMNVPENQDNSMDQTLTLTKRDLDNVQFDQSNHFDNQFQVKIIYHVIDQHGDHITESEQRLLQKWSTIAEHSPPSEALSDQSGTGSLPGDFPSSPSSNDALSSRENNPDIGLFHSDYYHRLIHGRGGMQPLRIAQLPLTVYGSPSKAEVEECQICRMAFRKSDWIRTLPCFHFYHPQCIDPWLAKKGSCPVCLCMIDRVFDADARGARRTALGNTNANVYNQLTTLQRLTAPAI